MKFLSNKYDFGEVRRVTGFPMSKCCFSSDSFDTFGKDLVHVRALKLVFCNGLLT